MGEPFSPTHVPAGQGYGRFDLPGEGQGVVYHAEAPEHAIAEKIVRLRNQSLADVDLLEFVERLALVEVGIDLPTNVRLLDLCDAGSLVAEGLQPDRSAYRDRAFTQAISAHAFGRGYAGLRWWSAFFGEWHSVIAFRARVAAESMQFGAPEPLHARHPAVRDAAEALGIAIE
jgi:hypothetical protein